MVNNWKVDGINKINDWISLPKVYPKNTSSSKGRGFNPIEGNKIKVSRFN